jgi:acetyltransferase
MRNGRFFPDHGLERIVSYHERQDARFAQAAADISDATGKPILTATELAIASPDNAGPATVRATGRVCYASANRAVLALSHLWADARFRSARGIG